MAELAGLFLWIEKKAGFGRAVGVVAEAAFLKDMDGVGVRFREAVFGVACEAASLETEAASAADAVTLRALYGFQRRMLPVGLESRGWIGSHEDADLFAATFPEQRQLVLARRGLDPGVEDVGEGLLGFDRFAVELETAGGRGGDDAHGSGGQGGAVDGAQDLAFVLGDGDGGQKR